MLRKTQHAFASTTNEDDIGKKKKCRPPLFGFIFAGIILSGGRLLGGHVLPQDWSLGNHCSGLKVQ